MNDSEPLDNSELLKEYSLVGIFKEFGILKILLNVDSVSAYILTFIVSYFYIIQGDFFINVGSIGTSLISANAGMLGVVIAGFSISIAIMDMEFLLFLDKFGLYREMIFQFVFTSVVVGIGLLFSIGLSLSLPFKHQISFVFFIFSILFTCFKKKLFKSLQFINSNFLLWIFYFF